MMRIEHIDDATLPIPEAVRALVNMLQTSGTVSGDRIYFPERRTRELLSVVRVALTAAQQQGHYCKNCLGIQPETCLFNPPPQQQGQVACVACEGRPAPENNPCGWCGRTTPQPTQQGQAMSYNPINERVVESIAALLHEEATDEPWTVAGIEHDGPDRTYYRELASKVVNLFSTQQQDLTT
jgi:hypothetical protein